LTSRISRTPFLDHLEELRRRLLVSLTAFGIFSAASCFFSKSLVEFLTFPLRQLDLVNQDLYFTAPYEAFLVHLKVSLLTGLLAGSPVLFYQLWGFVAPGLHRRERALVLPLTLLSVFLFLAGAAFAFFVVVPTGLQFLLSFKTYSIQPLLGIDPYFSFLVGMILACGILFDLPVVVLGLVQAGVIGPQALRNARKGVIVSVFLLAAILTPSPDPVGQLLLAIPIILLYEVCVRVAKWFSAKHRGGSAEPFGGQKS